MPTLIVVSHPDRQSLTHHIAAQLAEGIAASGSHVDIADLAAEGFDPRFTQHDIAAFRQQGPVSQEIVAEQARIDRADTLILVYPVYWWSMPAQLKGWIDRVFTHGWAYEDSEGGLVKKLQRLKVHLVALGAGDMRTYARHGYFAAMRTQIDHGIFDFCGAEVVTSELLLQTPGEALSAEVQNVKQRIMRRM
ncbi:NAD(P)H-dependent oxidoreductase [Erwinia persicina]|uniref:NAD(P)H-dependent oxidoreductase n=1 Tax=Erwinia persicina TaxID=55211 RepID=UPI0017876177|nr:NAD(P)H-dependent oxidoreductase [Erwinia persicina]MBD8165647.1 NAD(P)H-dependent oxidoreductase [Erwinia persicina]MBD8216857.1 NAD(P)H-dependent oxidoreductase [Erwinia persicina]